MEAEGAARERASPAGKFDNSSSPERLGRYPGGPLGPPLCAPEGDLAPALNHRLRRVAPRGAPCRPEDAYLLELLGADGVRDGVVDVVEQVKDVRRQRGVGRRGPASGTLG